LRPKYALISILSRVKQQNLVFVEPESGFHVYNTNKKIRPKEEYMGLVKHKELPEIKLAAGIYAYAVHGATLTVMHVRFEEGALVPEHAHHHEQIVNVIEGELELTVDGAKHSLTPGKSMILEPNIPHSGLAITPCRVVDVFHPVREDLK
jgi:quercetin dioxygenase-like cupin family protein